MADILEDNEVSDRIWDAADFKQHQFTLFKHWFRTSAVSAENFAIQAGFEDGFNRLATVCRQLGRLKGAITAIALNKKTEQNPSGPGLISEINLLLQRFEAQQKNVEALSVENSEEFSIANVGLPTFDPLDLEAFVGNFNDSAENDENIFNTKNSAKLLKEEIEECCVKAQYLLNSGCKILHENEICDDFIHL